MTADIPFTNFTRAGFESVETAFKDNFYNGEELGAQFCAYQNGRLLVDFCGGWRNRQKTQPVTDTTLFSIYSSGKVAAALVIAHLVDQDRIGYDQTVQSIWPDFGADGKDTLTIAQVLSHQAGLSGITDPNFTAEDWYDWDKTCAVLAAQTPIFPPTSASGYHPVTYGILTGEIARRVDIDGRTLGRILHEDICAPHDIDLWIGLPETEHERCSDIVRPRAAPDLGEMNAAKTAAFGRVSASPNAKDLTRWRKAEFAGSNAQSTAKAMARLATLLLNGSLEGEKYLAEDTLSELRKSRISGENLVLPFELDFAAGIMRNAPNYFYGPNAETLGHSGWGGSCIFADPKTGITGAYAMNKQDNSLLGDTRPIRIIDALYTALD